MIELETLFRGIYCLFSGEHFPISTPTGQTLLAPLLQGHCEWQIPESGHGGAVSWLVPAPGEVMGQKWLQELQLGEDRTPSPQQTSNEKLKQAGKELKPSASAPTLTFFFSEVLTNLLDVAGGVRGSRKVGLNQQWVFTILD